MFDINVVLNFVSHSLLLCHMTMSQPFSTNELLKHDLDSFICLPNLSTYKHHTSNIKHIFVNIVAIIGQIYLYAHFPYFSSYKWKVNSPPNYYSPPYTMLVEMFTIEYSVWKWCHQYQHVYMVYNFKVILGSISLVQWICEQLRVKQKKWNNS